MKTSKNILTDKEMELVNLLMQDCQSTGNIQPGFPETRNENDLNPH